MAVVNTLSTSVTNNDGKYLNPAYKGGGLVRQMTETLEVASGDSVGSTYRFFRVWSGWRVDSMVLWSDDIGTTTIADFGLYDVAAVNGGAVVDADFFGSAVSLKDGAVSNTDITYESAVVAIENRPKRIWEQLGLTADPGKW